jgi:hypothetical protein
MHRYYAVATKELCKRKNWPSPAGLRLKDLISIGFPILMRGICKTTKSRSGLFRSGFFVVRGGWPEPAA